MPSAKAQVRMGSQPNTGRQSAAAAKKAASENAAPIPQAQASFIEQLIGTANVDEALEDSNVQGIVDRIHKVVDDDDVSIESVTNMIATEPELAKRIMAMANSVALNPRRVPVKDLRMAVLRAGLNFVSSTMVAYTVKQLSCRSVMAGMEDSLAALWHRAVLIASLCYVIAKRLTRINPDMAMLTGLLHGVGRLYVVTHKKLAANAFKGISFYKSIEQEWSKDILKSMRGDLYGQGPESLTILETQRLSKYSHAMAALSDILMAATIIAVYENDPETMQEQLANTRVESKLGLSSEITKNLLEESAEELKAIQALLI